MSSQQPPPVVANRYRVIREIGRGGMGAVFLVKHLNTGDYLALKLLHENALGHNDAVERFKREMRLPAKIRSDNVVKITDADTAPELGGAPFLVMELLTGCDLCRVLQKQGKRSGEEVIWIFSQIAKALDKAHSLGIVHRDLKPENLFVHRREDESLMIKILDFGIAKLTEDIRRTSMQDAAAGKMTSSVGTPLYMAPEQAQGQAPGAPPIGPGTDIWAIGMMVFELLTGETYLRGANAMELIAQILFSSIEAPSRRVSTLPAAFDAWFLKSCDRDPSRRWATVAEQIAALRTALGVAAPAGAPQSLIKALTQLAPSGVTSVEFTTLSGNKSQSAFAPTQEAPSAFSASAASSSDGAQGSGAGRAPAARAESSQAATVISQSARAVKKTSWLGLAGSRRILIPALGAVLLVASLLAVLLARSCAAAPRAAASAPPGVPNRESDPQAALGTVGSPPGPG